MIITGYEKHRLLSRFKSVELSYEKEVYKKVHNANLYMGTMSGTKYFAWFTYYNKSDACFIIKLTKNSIASVELIPCCFNKTLSNGTIVYGSIIEIEKVKYFYTEELLQLNGKYFDKEHWTVRIQKMDEFFMHIKQFAYQKNFIVFTSAFISSKFDDIVSYITAASFNIDFIQARNLNDLDYKNFNFKNVKKYEKKTAVFQIRAEIKSDIYSLYTKEGRYYEFFNIAHIPDYKTSIIMNTLFRTIKENINLDALEESDDEEEFENIDEDKFVFLDKKINMRCDFSHRFKKWIPREITDSAVMSFKDIQN